MWFLNSITVFHTTVLWPNNDRLNCSSQFFLALRGYAAPQSLLQKHRSRCWSSDLDQSCVTFSGGSPILPHLRQPMAWSLANTLVFCLDKPTPEPRLAFCPVLLDHTGIVV